uniref:Uncharacterized protein n=1 Tax=Pyxicephalus adspersus TaxID=30357 RepID=A0AAV3B592_PYXAD|nr:TPA: hypothetical protein GDO54_000226 [Pyxicephalus adspersus]
MQQVRDSYTELLSCFEPPFPMLFPQDLIFLFTWEALINSAGGLFPGSLWTQRGQTELCVGCDGMGCMEAVRHCMTEASDLAFMDPRHQPSAAMGYSKRRSSLSK